MILPSTAAAFYVGFYFESFPAAVRTMFGDTNAATLSMEVYIEKLEGRYATLA